MSDFTHFLRFDDEASAKAALPEHWVEADDGWAWLRSHVDGPISIMRGTGDFETVEGEQVEVTEPVPGYHLNIGKTKMDTSLPGLVGIWNEGRLVYGDKPNIPAVVF